MFQQYFEMLPFIFIFYSYNPSEQSMLNLINIETWLKTVILHLFGFQDEKILQNSHVIVNCHPIEIIFI